MTDPAAPPNAGCYRALEVRAPEGAVACATYPAPTAAGNVETSQRIVDVLFGAFAQAVPDRVPAPGQGTMNNLLIRADGSEEELSAKGTWQLGKGARVRVETPGGGRWGTPAR